MGLSKPECMGAEKNQKPTRSASSPLKECLADKPAKKSKVKRTSANMGNKRKLQSPSSKKEYKNES